MKNWICGLMMIMAIAPALSAEPSGTEVPMDVPGDIKIEDKLGTIRYIVWKTTEPANEEFRIKLLVKCNDLRAKPNAAKPAWTQVIPYRERRDAFLPERTACGIVNPYWNAETKEFVVRYNVSVQDGAGQLRCSEDGAMSQTFHLDTHCEKWSR